MSLVRYGRHRFLLTGDAETKLEGRILAEWTGPERIDVLTVGHHGCALLSPSSPAGAPTPSASHPHPLVMERLNERGIPVFRTDEHGLITVRSDGRYLTWHTPGVGRSPLPIFAE